MTTIRLILDEPAPGDWNMAVDEALLEGAAAIHTPTLRFYAWQEPTVSLGYFQPLAARAMHPASQFCPVVRRTTGGGAIVHHRELTYSFLLPQKTGELARFGTGAMPLYAAFHKSLIRVLRAMNLPAEWCSAPQKLGHAHEPFLCFLRRSEGDVVIGSHKVAGSAQRRRGGAILQHGSLLLASSPAVPELPGIFDLLGKSLENRTLIENWLRELAVELRGSFQPNRLSLAEQARAALWQCTQFGTPVWNGKR